MHVLICFHGLMSSNNDFSYIKKELKDYYDVIFTPDLPGHGKNQMKFKAQEVFDYCLSYYDTIAEKYSDIDVLGYSLGGVVALYIQQLRKINKMILLAPALVYYKIKKIKDIPFDIKEFFANFRINYVVTFMKIAKTTDDRLAVVYPDVLVVLGELDQLVSPKSGYIVFEKAIYRKRAFIIMPKLDHFNILHSQEVINHIELFIT